jgi:uncharacterized membrane protein
MNDALNPRKVESHAVRRWYTLAFTLIARCGHAWIVLLFGVLLLSIAAQKSNALIILVWTTSYYFSLSIARELDGGVTAFRAIANALHNDCRSISAYSLLFLFLAALYSFVDGSWPTFAWDASRHLDLIPAASHIVTRDVILIAEGISDAH